MTMEQGADDVRLVGWQDALSSRWAEATREGRRRQRRSERGDGGWREERGTVKMVVDEIGDAVVGVDVFNVDGGGGGGVVGGWRLLRSDIESGFGVDRGQRRRRGGMFVNAGKQPGGCGRSRVSSSNGSNSSDSSSRSSSRTSSSTSSTSTAAASMSSGRCDSCGSVCDGCG